MGGVSPHPPRHPPCSSNVSCLAGWYCSITDITLFMEPRTAHIINRSHGDSCSQSGSSPSDIGVTKAFVSILELPG